MERRERALIIEHLNALPTQSNVTADGQSLADRVADAMLSWRRFAAVIGRDDVLAEDCVRYLLDRDLLEGFTTNDVRRIEFVRAWIELADEAYRQVTVEDELGFAIFVAHAPATWWWRRLPRRPGTDLKRSLEKARGQ